MRSTRTTTATAPQQGISPRSTSRRRPSPADCCPTSEWRNVERYVIFNADDFGASNGVNRGIVECHRNGVVSSTSLMVSGRAVDEAVELAASNPDLAIGLHFDVWGEDEREFDLGDKAAVRDEFRRQL